MNLVQRLAKIAEDLEVGSGARFDPGFEAIIITDAEDYTLDRELGMKLMSSIDNVLALSEGLTGEETLSYHGVASIDDEVLFELEGAFCSVEESAG